MSTLRLPTDDFLLFPRADPMFRSTDTATIELSLEREAEKLCCCWLTREACGRVEGTTSLLDLMETFAAKVDEGKPLWRYDVAPAGFDYTKEGVLRCKSCTGLFFARGFESRSMAKRACRVTPSIKNGSRRQLDVIACTTTLAFGALPSTVLSSEQKRTRPPDSPGSWIARLWRSWRWYAAGSLPRWRSSTSRRTNFS